MEDHTTCHRLLLPRNGQSQHINLIDELVNVSSEVVVTLAHEVIRQWAGRNRRQVRPHRRGRTPWTLMTAGPESAPIFLEPRHFGQSVGNFVAPLAYRWSCASVTESFPF
jgi:hypothetical protein